MRQENREWLGFIPIAGLHLLDFCSSFEHIRDFFEHTLTFRGVLPADGGGHTRIQVVLQNGCTDFIQGCLDCLYLAHDIDTIGVFLDHADDTTHVSCDDF